MRPRVLALAVFLLIPAAAFPGGQYDRGACCLDGTLPFVEVPTCVEVTPKVCKFVNGKWQGFGVTCAELNHCVYIPVTLVEFKLEDGDGILASECSQNPAKIDRKGT